MIDPRTRKLAFLALLSVFPLSVIAQSGSFIVSQHGHSVGTATVTFAGSPAGLDTTTVIKVSMQGLNYNLSKTEQLTSANRIKHAQLSATVNGSASDSRSGHARPRSLRARPRTCSAGGTSRGSTRARRSGSRPG